MRDKGVGVGLGRLEAQFGHHLGSGTNLAGGQHRAQALDFGHGGQELIDRREAILTLRRDHLHQHIDQCRAEVGATFELLGVLGLSLDRRRGVVERILAGQALIEGDAQGVKVTVHPIRSIRLGVVIVIRRQVTARAATALNLIVLGYRNVEVNDADTLIGPQQVGGLDVLMVNAVLVKMGQPIGGLAHDAHGIIQRQRLGIDQVGDIQTFHILKDDVRRLLGVGHAVRPDHLHHMRMVGQIGQGFVFAA